MQQISDAPKLDLVKNVIIFEEIHMQQISDTPKLDLVKKCNNLWRDSYATNFWHSKTWLSEKM